MNVCDNNQLFSFEVFFIRFAAVELSFKQFEHTTTRVTSLMLRNRTASIKSVTATP